MIENNDIIKDNNLLINKQINSTKVKSYSYLVIFLLSAIMFLLIPSSKNAIVNSKTVELFLMNAILILFILFNGKMVLSCFMLVLFEVFILLLYTALTFGKVGFNDIQMGVALQYLVYGLLSITKFSPAFKYKQKIYSDIFVSINILMILWGIGLVLKLPIVMEFTINNYSHATPWMLPVMLRDGKPILSFQVHSLAAYYWGALFFLNYLGLKYEVSNRKKIHIVLMFFDFTLCLLNKSKTAILLSVIMIIFTVYVTKKRDIYILIFMLIFIGTLIFVKSNLINYFMSLHLYTTEGGIGGRYGSGLFDNFFNTVKKNGFIGLAINNRLYTYDSGFVANYMRGGLLLNITYFGSMIKFFLSNFKKNIAIFASLMFLGLDFFTTSLMYPQVISFIIFAVMYVKYLNDLEIY